MKLEYDVTNLIVAPDKCLYIIWRSITNTYKNEKRWLATAFH